MPIVSVLVLVFHKFLSWKLLNFTGRIFFGGGNTFSKKFWKNCVNNFVKIFKKFAKNLQKYSKKIQKIFKKFLKFSKNFQKNFFIKMLKIDFLSIFSKNLTNPAFNFCAFGRKTHILWKFRENFRKLWKDFLRKLQKMHYLH